MSVNSHTELLTWSAAEAHEAGVAAAAQLKTGRLPQKVFPAVAFVGPRGCGKDFCAELLRLQFSGLTYHGSTSTVIIAALAQHTGLSPGVLRVNKNALRGVLYHFGRGLCAANKDPAFLVRTQFCAGANILAGLRSYEELLACRQAQLVDLVLWVERPDCYEDGATLQFCAKECDLVLRNDGLRSTLAARLRALGLALGYTLR